MLTPTHLVSAALRSEQVTARRAGNTRAAPPHGWDRVTAQQVPRNTDSGYKGEAGRLGMVQLQAIRRHFSGSEEMSSL